MPNQSEQLQKLRDLLLRKDVARLTELEKELGELHRRIDDTDEWLEKLDPVIADALARKITDSKEEMAEALAPVMGAAIKTQIQDAKDDMVDALYPVIGSTIRKSMAEAIKNLTRAVNEKIDRALSFELLFKRLKSRVTGVPEADLVLKDALPFQIHEIFLIHKASGLLISHVSNRGVSRDSDTDVISGMLTAIRDFANSAFAQNGNRGLAEIKYEDLQIHLEDGRYAYLAVVTSGFVPDNFADEVRRCEHQIHNRFHKKLRQFDGEVLRGAEPVLQKLLREYAPAETAAAETARKTSYRGLVYLVGLAALVLAAYAIFSWLPQKRLERKIATQVEAVLAGTPFAKGAEITYRIDGHTVVLNGQVENAHVREDLQALLLENTDARRVENHLQAKWSEAFVAELKKRIQTSLPARTAAAVAELKLIQEGSTLTLLGQVPSEADKHLVARRFAEIAPAEVIINELGVSQKDRGQQLRAEVEQQRIYFDSNSSTLSDSARARMRHIVGLLKNLDFQKLTILSYSDNQGNDATNARLCKQRAEKIKRFLTQAGVDPGKLEIAVMGNTAPVASNSTAEGRARNRRVEFSFSPRR